MKRRAISREWVVPPVCHKTKPNHKMKNWATPYVHRVPGYLLYTGYNILATSNHWNNSTFIDKTKMQQTFGGKQNIYHFVAFHVSSLFITFHCRPHIIIVYYCSVSIASKTSSNCRCRHDILLKVKNIGEGIISCCRRRHIINIKMKYVG